MKILSIVFAVLAVNVCLAGSIDTNYYNMHLDSDGDGWSNWSEYLAGTDPTDPASKPSVPVRVVLDYNGYLGPSAQSLIAGGRSIHMTFYDSPSMDGWPIYTLVTNSVDFTLNIPFEGDLYAWATAQAGPDYDPVFDPAAMITFSRAWGSSIQGLTYMQTTLTDDRQMRGFPRMIWDPVPDEQQAVTLGYTVIAKQGRTTLFTRFIENPRRNYIHDGDYLHAGTDGVGGDGSQEAYTFEVYKNNSSYGYDSEIPHSILIAIVTNTVNETPAVVTGRESIHIYAINEIEWSMDPNASWYEIQIARPRVDDPSLPGSVLESSGRKIIPYKSKGLFKARLPFFAGDSWHEEIEFTNGLYYAFVRSGMDAGALLTSDPLLFRLAVSTNTSKFVKGQLSYAGTNYFSASTSTNLLPVVVQFYTSPLYVGLPDAQIQIAASAWTTNEMAPTANYEIGGLRKGQDYYGRAFVDVNANKTMETYESRAVGYDFTKAKPIPIRVPSHELVTTNYNMTIIDTDIDNDGLPDIWEWYKSGTITNGPLELGSM